MGQTMLAALVVFVGWGVVDAVVALGWFALFVTLAAARATWRGRVAPSITDSRRLRSVLRRDVWVSALLWGVWSMLLIGASVLNLAMLMIVIAGIIAAATSTLVADAKSFYGFMGILIGSLLITVVLSGLTRDHLSLLLLISLFVPFMLSVHGRANAVLRSQIESASRLAISEEETARGRNFMNALVAHAPSAMVVLDQDSQVLRANPAFERVTGFTGVRFTDATSRSNSQREMTPSH
ncbi:MAG: PAS domain-containing protein [Gemmatimonadetes bacterium]|nr:PAS domain-containing protein [Gemmatimonadota bacterium]